MFNVHRLRRRAARRRRAAAAERARDVAACRTTFDRELQWAADGARAGDSSFAFPPLAHDSIATTHYPSPMRRPPTRRDLERRLDLGGQSAHGRLNAFQRTKEN